MSYSYIHNKMVYSYKEVIHTKKRSYSYTKKSF